MADPTFGTLSTATLPLFTDLYELTMMRGYVESNHDPRATFSLFVRELPPERGYVVATGLEQVIHYVQNLSFDDEAMDAVAELGFDEAFLEYLSDFEFTGEVRALPEGTPVFANEPLLEVTAPISQAQVFETLAINQVGYQSLIATKAARMREMVDRYGDGQTLVDFGSRRAHGTDAGMKAARASYVGGFDGTSNVAAGDAFDVPAYGTMAHSWVQSFPTEREAFEAFVDVYGEDSILLVDTYDTVAGARTAQTVAEERDVDVAGVRLDSGDLTALSKAVDEFLDADIFVSSGMDEYKIRDFLLDGGVATGFGPGTALVTSSDAPKMEGVYKLVAVEEEGEMRPSMKLSTGKVTYPGQKSVYRVERDGTYVRDTLALRDTDHEGTDQLVQIFSGGELVYDVPELDDVREHARRERHRLPEAVRTVEDPDPYPVTVGDGLQQMTDDLSADLGRRYG